MSLSPRFSEALVYACSLHADQRRKASDVPYIAHLLAVAAIALEHGADEDEAIAAVLHDAVEDQGGAAVLAEIHERFGPRVAVIVEACTDSHSTPKPPWRERKEQHLTRLLSADSSAHLICAADKLHNVRAIVADYRLHGESLWQRFNGGREGTLWYYRAMASALANSAPAPLVEALERELCELERLAAAGV